MDSRLLDSRPPSIGTATKKKGKGKNRLPQEPEGEMSDDAIERLRKEIEQEKKELANLRKEFTDD